MCTIPLLNLDNFENECLTRSTPYVLTSPTSLRACAKLLIEPSELVYRSLEKYEEDLAGLPLSEIYRVYEDNETERQEKLLRCRQVRKSLQVKPFEEQRKRLVHLQRIPMRAERSSSAGRGSSQQRHVVLEYNSDTESVDGEGEQEQEQDEPQQSHSRSRSSTAEARSTSSATIRQASQSTRSTRSSAQSNAQRQQRPTTSSQSQQSQSRHKSCVPSQSQSAARRAGALASSSVPNLTNKRGNLNFGKIIPDRVSSSGMLYHHASSPTGPGHDHHLCHYLCHCPSLRPLTDDKQLINDCMKRYGDLILSASNKSVLSHDDQKIMQLLLLKKGRALEWDQRAQELRALIEYEKLQRAKRSQVAAQKWYQQLAEKRRQENMRNTQRYLSIQRRDMEHRENLERFLERRDNRVQSYLKQLAEQRNSQILERHRQETLKQLEVGRAIERLLEQDEENRIALAENLEKRMHNAELRKRRREQDHWRHIYEMNRLDEEKRQLMHEQIEKTTQNSIQQLRNQLEEKEARGALNYQAQLKMRHALPKDRGRKHEEAIAKAQALHSQLLEGLDDWYKKVFELHLAAQERASQNYVSQLSSRRSRLANERCLREERSSERIRHVHEEESKRRAIVKSIIETKEQKSARLQQEKERKVQFSRRRAQHAAELRQQLREKLDPDTFDKKVARVEVELRLLKHSDGNYLTFKNGSPSVHYHNIKLNGGGNGNGNGNGKRKSVEFRKGSNGGNGNGNGNGKALAAPPAELSSGRKPITCHTHFSSHPIPNIGRPSHTHTAGKYSMPIPHHFHSCHCGCGGRGSRSRSYYL